VKIRFCNRIQKVVNGRLFLVSILSSFIAIILVGCYAYPPPRQPRTLNSAKSVEFISNKAIESQLRIGDQIEVRIDLPSGSQQVHVAVIDGDGKISLPLIGTLEAVGLTSGKLAERIQASYVPKFYVRCNVTILPSQRFFYMGGEVRNPGRHSWDEDMSLLKAIDTAGGFTDFANKKKVELTRGGKKMEIDCEELRNDPSKDMSILPGDSVRVSRGIF